MFNIIKKKSHIPAGWIVGAVYKFKLVSVISIDTS